MSEKPPEKITGFTKAFHYISLGRWLAWPGALLDEPLGAVDDGADAASHALRDLPGLHLGRVGVHLAAVVLRLLELLVAAPAGPLTSLVGPDGAAELGAVTTEDAPARPTKKPVIFLHSSWLKNLKESTDALPAVVPLPPSHVELSPAVLAAKGLRVRHPAGRLELDNM